MCVDSILQNCPTTYCPTCRNEECVYILTDKTTSFYDCRKYKACCHVSSIPFKDKTPTIMLFGGDGTQCLARKTSRQYGKEKQSPFLKNFLRQSQPSTSEPERKKADSLYGIIVSTSHWLIQITKTSFTFSFYKLLVYFNAT